MLNIFPIQFLAPLAYFLLRICVGIIFIVLGIRHLRKKNRDYVPAKNSLFISTGIIELAVGLLFVLGAYTQIAALVALCMANIHILRPRLLHYPGHPSRIFFVLIVGICFSLFITGAGVFAFDLPL